MKVKVQRALNNGNILVYNKDRTVMWQGANSLDVLEKNVPIVVMGSIYLKIMVGTVQRPVNV